MPSPNPPSKQSQPASDATNAVDAVGSDFETELTQTELQLQALRDRYSQVTAAQGEQQSLKVQQARVQHELKQHRRAALKQELAQIKARMDELELTLESQLFSWGSLSEPFWQAVRFGGLGLVVGWFLRAMVNG
ncbi:MAG: hypothetical protein WBA10_21950 [Elainellaceae cyanobacterium]